ncbi:hypothetical protein CRENBAI_006695 [Crenichthys baileyi]|uniref:Uncharacterized protein n=1 Tax=Crenichthys baileyi TaxID=28760 RepID=A0AAV9QS99_9TELE
MPYAQHSSRLPAKHRSSSPQVKKAQSETKGNKGLRPSHTGQARESIPLVVQGLHQPPAARPLGTKWGRCPQSPQHIGQAPVHHGSWNPEGSSPTGPGSHRPRDGGPPLRDVAQAPTRQAVPCWAPQWGCQNSRMQARQEGTVAHCPAPPQCQQPYQPHPTTDTSMPDTLPPPQCTMQIPGPPRDSTTCK